MQVQGVLERDADESKIKGGTARSPLLLPLSQHSKGLEHIVGTRYTVPLLVFLSFQSLFHAPFAL